MSNETMIWHLFIFMWQLILFKEKMKQIQNYTHKSNPFQFAS